MKQIGILGGTFDPPHIGHLIIAEVVKDARNLDEIWFVPTNQPPHKQDALSSADDRIKMLQKAIKNNDAFKINSIEVERQGKSYTIDTIQTFKQHHPDKQFYFIIGADMVEYLPHWFKIDQLLELVTFVGVQRSGYHLKSPYPIQTVDVPLVDISSTKIRERIAQNKTVNYLLPEKVLSYIRDEGLYEG